MHRRRIIQGLLSKRAYRDGVAVDLDDRVIVSDPAIKTVASNRVYAMVPVFVGLTLHERASDKLFRRSFEGNINVAENLAELDRRSALGDNGLGDIYVLLLEGAEANHLLRHGKGRPRAA